MTNKKKILIETLHGSVAQLNELSSMTEGIDIYDDTGCVDTDFLIEAISCVSAFMDASNIVVQKISSLLAPDAPVGEKKKQADEGKKWNVEEILKHCTLENNILKLPQVQFNKKSYAEAKKLAYIVDYEIDDDGEVVPSLRQLDCNGGMSAIPLYVNFKKTIIELV